MLSSLRQPLTPRPYIDECLTWRRGLSEVVVRSLASDYLRGIIEPCTTDAFQEYEYRWGPHEKGPQRISKPKKARAKRVK